MDSAIRPRDIQARIRAGETPEAVAEAAQTSVDRIMAFAAPVLAERQHVADRAQRSSVRRRTGDGGSPGGARTLGEAVAGHLRSLNVDPDTVEWDAWRREDGRWALTGDFATTRRNGSGHFTYDAPGNYVTADNADAHWLIGEGATDEVAGSADPAVQVGEPRDDLRSARQRRLITVLDEELPLGDDAIEMVTGTDQPEPAVAAAAPGAGTDDLPVDQPLEPFLDEEAPTEAETPPVRHEDNEPPPRRQVKKRGGRASVPSWDEIMFGGGKND